MRLPMVSCRVVAALACLWVAGCATLPAESPPAGPAPAAAADSPLAAFARDATPGQRAVIEVSPGRQVPVTMQRAYTAASGRECRLLRIEDVPGGRGELVCRDIDRGWQAARSLLRGGAVAAR